MSSTTQFTLSISSDSAVTTVPCSLAELTLYFLRLGAFGFGGPIALAGYMQRDLVEVRGWISKEDYVEGLALAQLAPGPLAAQLATYLGWVRGGVLGATLTSIAFIVPSIGVFFIPKRIPEPLIIVAAGLVGLVVRSTT